MKAKQGILISIATVCLLAGCAKQQAQVWVPTDKVDTMLDTVDKLANARYSGELGLSAENLDTLSTISKQAVLDQEEELCSNQDARYYLDRQVDIAIRSLNRSIQSYNGVLDQDENGVITINYDGTAVNPIIIEDNASSSISESVSTDPSEQETVEESLDAVKKAVEDAVEETVPETTQETTKAIEESAEEIEESLEEFDFSYILADLADSEDASEAVEESAGESAENVEESAENVEESVESGVLDQEPYDYQAKYDQYLKDLQDPNYEGQLEEPLDMRTVDIYDAYGNLIWKAKSAFAASTMTREENVAFAKVLIQRQESFRQSARETIEIKEQEEQDNEGDISDILDPTAVIGYNHTPVIEDYPTSPFIKYEKETGRYYIKYSDILNMYDRATNRLNYRFLGAVNFIEIENGSVPLSTVKDNLAYKFYRSEYALYNNQYLEITYKSYDMDITGKSKEEIDALTVRYTITVYGRITDGKLELDPHQIEPQFFSLYS